MEPPKFVSYGLCRPQGYFDYLKAVILDVMHTSTLKVALPLLVNNLTNKPIYIKVVPQNTNYNAYPDYVGKVDPQITSKIVIELTRSSMPQSFPYQEEIALIVEGYEDENYQNKLGDTLVDFEVVITKRDEMNPVRVFDFSDGTTQGIEVESASHASIGITSNRYTSPSYALAIKLSVYYAAKPSIKVVVPTSDLEPRRYLVILDVIRLGYYESGYVRTYPNFVAFRQRVPNYTKDLLVIDESIINYVLPLGSWRTIGFAIAPINGELGNIEIEVRRGSSNSAATSQYEALIIDDIYVVPY